MNPVIQSDCIVVDGLAYPFKPPETFKAASSEYKEAFVTGYLHALLADNIYTKDDLQTVGEPLL